MLTATESAKQLLKEALIAHSDDPRVVLRLSFDSPGKFKIIPDREVEGDQVIEHEDGKILVVASELAPMVERVTLDVRDTTEGSKLVIRKE